jgi:hypothetical protein
MRSLSPDLKSHDLKDVPGILTKKCSQKERNTLSGHLEQNMESGKMRWQEADR